MKTTLLLALILSATTSFSQEAVRARVITQTTRQTLVQTPTRVGGILPRVLTVPDPAQMISPFAPPEYGSGHTFVVYGNRDLASPNHQYERRIHPDGLRLLTIRPFW